MTLSQAKHTFGQLMQKARTGTLTAADKAELNRARQIIRASRKAFGTPMRNSKTSIDWSGYSTDQLKSLLKDWRQEILTSAVMTKADQSKLRKRIISAQQELDRRAKPNPSRKFKHIRLRSSKGLHHFRTITVGGHRVIIGCPVAHPKGSRCPVATVATSILHPRKEKRNPVHRKLTRMGKLVELRYHRDHGASPGFYRHAFKSKPTLYYDKERNQILAG